MNTPAKETELFNISNENLLKYLKVHIRNVNKKSVLPILDNLLFRLKENELTIISDDLENRIESKIRVNRPIGSEDVDILINAEYLFNLSKNIANIPLTFYYKYKDNDGEDAVTYILYIKHSNGIVKMDAYSSENYPKKATLDNSNSTVIEYNNFINGINYVSSFTSNDELRPVMCGVNFNINKNKITIVATDAHALGKYNAKTKSDVVVNFILNKKSINLLKDIAVQFKEDLFISYDESFAVFTISNFIVYNRLVDGDYPKYDAVIPEENDYVEVSKKSLLNAIKSTSLFTNKTTKRIIFDLKEDEILISGEDIDMSSSGVSVIDNFTFTGDFEIKIGFNYKLLLDMVNKISTSKIRIFISDNAQRAVVIKEEDSNIFLGLVMPIMIK